jgi:EF-P beta-lysylation protein EpmB
MAIVASRSSSVRTSQDGQNWQLALKTAVRDPRVLCRLLNLPPALAERAEQAARQFPVFAPLSYVARMRPADPQDPLLRQVLPLDAELEEIAGFVRDPVGDEAAQKQPGLLQKYAGRALLVTTGSCAVHCRYCFRRHFPYNEGPKFPGQWSVLLDQVAADPSLEEVLLSGGDPLMLPDTQLSALASRIAQIPHVSRLRIHSRLPIMIPQRVNRELIGWLRGTRLTPLMVVHANHPAELDAEVGEALGRLVDAGIPVLNQAVLLKGVNDRIEDLAALCRRLADLRVMPYYLHQLDRVQGAAHFEVPVERGRQLMRQLRDRLPGYAVPRYVAEVAGRGAKQPLE